MNLNHLKYFYDSARLGSISKSAELNFVGQPAISRAIQNLEIELGIELLRHQRKQLQLTDAGERLFSQSQNIFNAVASLREALSDSEKLMGTINFGCQSSMAEAFLGGAIRSLTQKHPNLKVNLKLGRTDLVRDWVGDEIIDLGIVIANLDLKGYHITQLSKGSFHLVSLANKKVNFKSEGVLLTEDTNEVMALKQKYLSIHNKSISTKMTIGSWGVIKNFVLQGLGVGFLPDYLIQKELKSKKLKIVNKKQLSIPYEIVMITKKQKYTGKNVNALKQALMHSE